MRVVFGVPLHTKRKCTCIGDANCLDRAVFGNSFDIGNYPATPT